MSSDGLAIEVSAVSKRFEVYARPRDQLKQLVLPRVQRLLGLAQRQYFHEFWALRDVSFSVARGESCGIVGLNGSGKSTLLQVIAGTLAPTAGEVRVNGRVAALLELGSGFNPSFSGRENAALSGALQGFSDEQVAATMEDIEAFADIGEHFDRPLSTYSSGMQLRVAFAAATAFDPQVLIVDEALAVGDAFFQHKCVRRLEAFKERGGTLLFVSHDPGAVKQLCDRAVLLSKGRRVGVGSPREIMDLYEGMLADMSDMGERDVLVTQQAQAGGRDIRASTMASNGTVELVEFRLLTTQGQPLASVESEKDIVVEFTLQVHQELDRPAYGLIVRDRLGRSIYEISTYAMGYDAAAACADSRVQVRFALNLNLRMGNYSFSIGVANRGYGRSDFEEYSLLMHDVGQVQVIEATGAPPYGGIFNMHARACVTEVDHV